MRAGRLPLYKGVLTVGADLYTAAVAAWGVGMVAVVIAVLTRRR